MRLNTKPSLGCLLSVVALISVPWADAQQKTIATPQVNAAYDVTRESVVQGTVVSYTAASSTGPLGAHAMIETSSGSVDVHLGSASLLKQNDIFLAPGDSVKIVGITENLGSGTVFLARVLRKGSQTVTLRNVNGIPLVAKPTANAKPRTIVGVAR